MIAQIGLHTTAAGQERQMGYGVIRWPVTWVKLREATLHTLNRRRQG